MNVLISVNQIEKIELALTIFNSKRALSNTEKELEMLQIGNSILLKDKISPQSIYYNRIKGFGLNDLNKLDQILEFYQQDQITPCFDMVPNQMNAEIAKALANKGFLCAEQLAFLQIQPVTTSVSFEHIKIEQVTNKNASEFIRLIGLSNEMEYEPELIEQKSHYFYKPYFINFIVYVEEQPAGIGSLFIREGEGYIANDYTFPEFRGKGCQTALIHHRLQLANEMGLKHIYTDVEFCSASHNNMVKLGFQLAFVNSFWMRF